jgi:penicillin amidase
VPNNFSTPIGPAPWAVKHGPSTRRIVDFADASKARGGTPVGQSGVLFDHYYSDQAAAFMIGGSMPQYLKESDVVTNTRDTLTLKPN